MRCAAVVTVLAFSLLALPVWANAQGTQPITMDRAVAQLGTPSYDHNCQDGTLTLAWKGQGDRIEPPVGPRSRPDLSARKTVVMKFDQRGALVWARQVH
jgi:hypothetical protein